MASHHEQQASKCNGAQQHWPAYNAKLAPPQASTEGLFQQTRLFSSVGVSFRVRFRKDQKRPAVLIWRNYVCVPRDKLKIISGRVSLDEVRWDNMLFLVISPGAAWLSFGFDDDQPALQLEGLVKTAEHCVVSSHFVVCIDDENGVKLPGG
jgi:hypothetical protein